MGCLDAAVFVELFGDDLVCLEAVHAGIGHPFDMLGAERTFEQALGVADTVQSQMADIGFRRDEGHRDAVADPRVAESLVEDEGEFIGRAEARGALDGTDHHRARIGDEPVEGFLRRERMIYVANGLGVVMRAETFDFIEGEIGTRGDDEVVVIEGAAIGHLDPVFTRMHARGALAVQGDVSFGAGGSQIDFDLFASPPADGHPWIGRHKGVGCSLAQEMDLDIAAEAVSQFIGHDRAAKTGTQDCNAFHNGSSHHLGGIIYENT